MKLALPPADGEFEGTSNKKTGFLPVFLIIL
jgi:hypothetical protein